MFVGAGLEYGIDSECSGPSGQIYHSWYQQAIGINCTIFFFFIQTMSNILYLVQLKTKSKGASISARPTVTADSMLELL